MPICGAPSESLAACERLLREAPSPGLQIAACQALVGSPGGESPKLILDHWREYTPEVAQAALDALLASEEGCRQLLGAGAAVYSTLDASRRQLLASHPKLYDATSNVPSSKLKRAVELLEELQIEGHRALVFSQFTSHLACAGSTSCSARSARTARSPGSTGASSRSTTSTRWCAP